MSFLRILLLAFALLLITAKAQSIEENYQEDDYEHQNDDPHDDYDQELNHYEEGSYDNHDEHDDEARCTHDSIEQNPELVDIDEDVPEFDGEGRVLTSIYPKLRMYVHSDMLNSVAASFRNYIKYQLVPPVVAYFQSAIRVKYPIKGKLTLSTKIKQTCGLRVPSILYSGVYADYFLMLNAEYGTGSTLATSYFCSQSSTSKRPFIVKITFNLNMLTSAEDVLTHEKNTYLLMHELIHTFGFSSSMYRYFLNENGRPRTGHIRQIKLLGSTRTVIDVPFLTQRLRNHFGCPSLEGAYMENNGGVQTAGSHFERRHFLYETMTSGNIIGRRISQFSLAMIEATGWYIPDYSFAEPFPFGRGQGCGFLKNSCTSSSFRFDEFCKGGAIGCAPHGRGGGYCASDSKSDGCRYHNPYINYDCENPNTRNYVRLPELQTFGRGLGSKCFTGTLSGPRALNTPPASFCFKFACYGSGTRTRLDVQIGNKIYTCNREGALYVNGYKGKIDCPDPMSFCNSVGVKYCPRNCMGRGKCMNGKCACYKGYKGIDCGLNI